MAQKEMFGAVLPSNNNIMETQDTKQIKENWLWLSRSKRWSGIHSETFLPLSPNTLALLTWPTKDIEVERN